MKTLILILALNMPPLGYTDDCLARLFEVLRIIDVRVRGGQYDEQQRLDATRRALLAYIECKGRPTSTPTSPRPD